MSDHVVLHDSDSLGLATGTINLTATNGVNLLAVLISYLPQWQKVLNYAKVNGADMTELYHPATNEPRYYEHYYKIGNYDGNVAITYEATVAGDFTALLFEYVDQDNPILDEDTQIGVNQSYTCQVTCGADDGGYAWGHSGNTGYVVDPTGDGFTKVVDKSWYRSFYKAPFGANQDAYFRDGTPGDWHTRLVALKFASGEFKPSIILC